MPRLVLLRANPDGSPKFVEVDQLRPTYTEYVKTDRPTGTVMVGYEARVWTPVGQYSEALDAHYFEHIPPGP